MNFADWYTDRVDIWRVQDRLEGGITRTQRVPMAQGVPCRAYRAYKNALASLDMGETAATTGGRERLMCPLETDLRPGDELFLSRGGGEPVRYFAGVFHARTEPFGAVLPGLGHLEGDIRREEMA